MFGTLVNTLAIVGGSLCGLLLRGGLPQAWRTTVIQAISLAVILIGLKAAFGTEDLLLVIVCMAIGGLFGAALQIEDRLEALGGWLEHRLAGAGDGFAKGFVTASLVYCVGSMAIVGALESGLNANHQILLAKSALDGISSVVFASTLGVGVAFSALPVFLYQGAITMAAVLVKPLLVPAVVSQMTAVGGLLITAIGINLLVIQHIRVGNMLPAIFMPLLYDLLLRLVS